MVKKYTFWFFTITIFLLLYHPVITTYFTQDDFFHFKVAQTDGSLKGLFYLVGFHSFEERQIAFYRPLFRDLLYHFSYNLYSLNHYPLRILSFILHLGNTYLVFKLMNKLFKNKFQSYFTAFFYTITASNVATLYYLAGGIQVLGALMFVLLTLLNYINFLENEDRKRLYLTFFTFIFAFASHEQSFILPFLLLGLTLIYKKGAELKKTVKTITPFFLILFIYLFLNYFVIGYSREETQYQALLDPKRTVNSLIWYSGWAMGLPEMLQDFMPSLISVDPRLMKYWGNYYMFIFPAFLISIGIFIFMFGMIFIKKNKLFTDKKLFLLVLWYLLGLAPVIFLPQHKSGHYLTVSLPAFWGILGYLVANFLIITNIGHKTRVVPLSLRGLKEQSNLKKAHYLTALKREILLNKIPVVILILSLLTLSSTSAILGKNFYWASQRGKLAEKLINQIKEKYPTLPKGATLYIKNDPNSPYVSEDWGSSSKQAYFILNGNDALQLLYHDNAIKVAYEDFGSPNTDFSEITLKIY